jgi:hypothetical protein
MLLSNQIEEKKIELENIEERINILRIQKDKEKLNLKVVPEKNYVYMTVGEFKELSNKFIENLPESVEKQAIINFLAINLTYIDSARATYDLIEIKNELPLEKLIAYIDDTGKIIWSVIDEVPNPNLIIGKPKLRVEYYTQIIDLIKKLSKNTVANN